MAHQCIVYAMVFMAYQCASQSCLRNKTVPCPQCPIKGYGPYPTCDQCIDSRLDPSSCCTQCKQGEEHCLNGNFDLTIVFYSYANPQHLCGECREEAFGPACCENIHHLDRNECTGKCFLRMTASVEAFSSPPLYINLQEESRNHVIFEDNIINFPLRPDIFPGVSNPYVTSITTWTERFQLYIVTFDFHQNLLEHDDVSAVDRFLIDVELGVPPARTGRERYFGIYNVSYFDISFDIKCSPHYYGKDCNTFCFPVHNLFTCDEMGRKTCVNQSCDPATSCFTCPSLTSSHAWPSTTFLQMWSLSPQMCSSLTSTQIESSATYLQTMSKTAALNTNRKFHIVLIGALVIGTAAILIVIAPLLFLLGMMLLTIRRIAAKKAVKSHEENITHNQARPSVDDQDMSANEAYSITSHHSPIYEAIF